MPGFCLDAGSRPGDRDCLEETLFIEEVRPGRNYQQYAVLNHPSTKISRTKRVHVVRVIARGDAGRYRHIAAAATIKPCSQ